MNDLSMPGKGFSALLSPDLFIRANLARSYEETRYYLNGVYVSAHPAGGALLVATDGHTLLAIRDPDACVMGEAIIQLSPEMVRACKASVKRFSKSARLVIHDRRAALINKLVMTGKVEVAKPSAEWLGDAVVAMTDLSPCIDALQWRYVVVDGIFPDWRRAVPKTVIAKALRANISIDARKLAPIAEALSADPRSHGVQLIGAGKHEPIIVIPSHAKVEGVGVIMPYTSYDEKLRGKIPGWFIAPKKPAPMPSPEMAEMVERIVSAEGGQANG